VTERAVEGLGVESRCLKKRKIVFLGSGAEDRTGLPILITCATARVNEREARMKKQA